MKTNKLLLITAAALSLVMAGCASSGNKVLKEETSKSVAEKITKGKTTKAQVRELYGDPMETSFTDSGKEIWKYHFIKAHVKATNFIPVVSMFASGSEGDKKELVVLFNSKGVVDNFSMSSSKVETNTSLFQ